MNIKNRNERPVNKEDIAKAIGDITLKFSLLEEIISNCISVLLGREGGIIVTAGLPFSYSLRILKALYIQKYNIGQDDDLPEKVKEMFIEVERANKSRNTIMHSFWHKGDTEESLKRIKKQLSKRGLKIIAEQVDTEELVRIANEIERAAKSAQEFTWEIIREKFTVKPILPLNGAIIHDREPELSWQELEDAVEYELQISNSANMLDIIVDMTGINSVRRTKYKCGITLDHNHKYYWRIRPIFRKDMGFWTEVMSFTVE